ncbi:hypothetical protein CO657_03580 [Rhizobium acidisoli]|uniref:Uncharacterized protein n=1 Tax=Rhizobium acidisoli TaxID=1538158 RepID=A0AAE5WLV8_9HYPH|nr:hypothetical protein [Rhizobium acidisoli]KPH10231.1 hypothetical protein AOG23_01545 [Rhizobium acidisoli]QAS77225.1 hypothetical protein CO657_03580 [Rhizobium acidisoli]
MNTSEASNIIMQEVKANISSGANAGGGIDNFCTIWPRAKPILDFLAGLALLIPGLGATAGAVLRGLIKVGDQIAQETCP